MQTSWFEITFNTVILYMQKKTENIETKRMDRECWTMSMTSSFRYRRELNTKKRNNVKMVSVKLEKFQHFPINVDVVLLSNKYDDFLFRHIYFLFFFCLFGFLFSLLFERRHSHSEMCRHLAIGIHPFFRFSKIHKFIVFTFFLSLFLFFWAPFEYISVASKHVWKFVHACMSLDMLYAFEQI